MFRYHPELLTGPAAAAAERNRPIWWIIDAKDRDRALVDASAAGIERLAIAWKPAEVDTARVRMILPGLFQALVVNRQYQQC